MRVGTGDPKGAQRRGDMYQAKGCADPIPLDKS
jgi:hypothetical protein